MSATATRQDIHRPSAPEFDPAAYVCLGVFDTDDRGAGFLLFGNQVDAIIRRGYTFDGPYGLAHRCGHCGSGLRYIAIMLHQPTGSVIFAGEDCLDHRFSLDTAEEFAALRAATAEQAKITREENRRNDIKAAVAAYITEIGDERLAELTYRGNGGLVDDNEFLSDIARKLFQYGNLSDRQIAAVGNAVARDAARNGRTEQRYREADARIAAGGIAPAGRLEVSGRVVHTWEKDGDYGVQQKMRVLVDGGWIAIATIPAALLATLDDPAEIRNQRITFTATFKRTGDDASTAYAGRPAKARRLA